MCIEGVAVVLLLVHACTRKDPDSSCGQMQLRLAFMPVGFIPARVSYLCLKSFEQSGSDSGAKCILKSTNLFVETISKS